MRIKGHTEIQLRDAKTGRLVQQTHDDNMVTNGLAEFLKNHGVLNNTPFVSAIRTNMINELLGGIMLFDDTLNENANNTHLPDGIKMTANAAYGLAHTGDPTELGSYDANETGWQNADHSVYRFVYTWTESQGNGVIKSASLTSRVHGIIGEGNAQSGKALSSRQDTAENCGYAVVGDCNKIVFKVKDNIMYGLTIDTSAQEFTISKTHISDTECAINDSIIENSIWEEIATLSNPSSASNLTNRVPISVRFIANSVVMMLHTNIGFDVITLNSDMDTITSYADVTATATSLPNLQEYEAMLSSDGAYIICSPDGDSTRSVYKIQVSNPTNVTQVTKVGDSCFGTDGYSVGKRHYTRDCVYDETLDKIFITNARADSYVDNLRCGDSYQDDKGFVFLSTGSYNRIYGMRNNAYLATINNLQNAVTKDSSQTMKVIYTLTFS